MRTYDPHFARYYDYLVHDAKESYAAKQDVDFLVNHLERLSPAKVGRILDVGCGTGRYLVPLAQRGYRMTGLDNSPEMLAQCRERLDKAASQAALIEQDMMALEAREDHDALLCMGSAISYLLSTEEILRALTVFRQALRPGGVLILEIWNIFANTHLFGQTSSQEIADGGSF